MTTAEATATEVTPQARLEGAHKTVKTHMYVAAGLGIVPLPMVDFIGVTGIQMNMLYRLAKHYEIPFLRDKAKNVLGTLIGGGISVTASRGLGSLVKGIPLVGTTIGVLTMPAVNAAATYAVGMVFIQHFESGGTFLNFNPESVREYYRAEFEKGKEMAKS